MMLEDEILLTRNYYFMIATDLHRYDDYPLFDRFMDTLAVAMGVSD